MELSLSSWLRRLTEPAYSKLRGGEEKNDSKSQGLISRIRNAVVGSTLKLRILVAVVVLALVVLLSRVLFVAEVKHLATPSSSDARYLHLLIPATRPDPNLCKTLTSASALRYPVPTLINYGQNLSAPDDRTQKISGVLSYLSTFPSSRDGDLVLLVDGYDVWFQLRPEVLLERYFEINRKADARISQRLGVAAVQKENLQHKLIFSAQKKCFPRDVNDPACFAAPESTLPSDVYGPETDHSVNNEENPYIKFRPKYLNSGIMMGELGAVRRLFNRAIQVMEENNQVGGSDQNIFSQIFGEQEFQREVIRERHLSSSQRLGRKIKSLFGMHSKSILDPHPTHRLMAAADGAPFDFGIGLDYESALGHPTVFAEYDSDWLPHNDSSIILQVSKKLGIQPPRVTTTLPDDIERSLPPFWSQNPQEDHLPQDLSWRNISLYTNVWTGQVPAVIHHNAHINDMKNQRVESWPKIWFQRYARQLMDAHVLEPHRPFARTMMPDGTEVEWWSKENKKWETHVHLQPGDEKEKEWKKWENLCSAQDEQEVFRDGRGAWRPPRWDY